MFADAGDSAPVAPRDSREGSLVLVVDDDDWVRSLAARALRDEGYIVLEAASGHEALDLLLALDGDSSPVALLITDVRMPAMSGRVLAEQVIERWPRVPILFMSGFDSGPSRGLSPLHPFLHKPFHPDNLVLLARALLPPAA